MTMMRLALLCAATLATPVVAQDAAAPPAKPVAVATATPAKPRLVCHTMEKTGSRLGGTRTCLTQHDWDERAKVDQDWLNQASRVHVVPPQP